MKSRKLMKFIEEIQFKNRNPTDNTVLSLLNDISTNPERTITGIEKLYRSRGVHDLEKINKSPDFYGYGVAESFIPPIKMTKDMRANYRYIPYLYCSDDPYLSVIEVRPRYGAYVSVATIAVKEEIRLLDFTMRNKIKTMKEVKQNLFSDLSELFSKPVAEDDDTLDYVPTQYIAEYAKNLGYDGIAFKSSLDVDSGKAFVSSRKTNIVVFNYQKCVPVYSNVYKITNNFIECEQMDSDIERKNINNPIEGVLSQINGKV